MTNSQIQTFLALCKYGSISAAAEALYVTQPALSRTIQALESELGYSLFTRSRGVRHMELSPEGERFYLIATEMHRLYLSAKEVTGRPVHRTFSIAAQSSLFQMFLPDACIRFQKEHPDVDLTVDSFHSTEAFWHVQAGRVDMALVCSHFIDPSVESRPLFREEAVLLCDQAMFPDGPVHPSQLERSKAVIVEWNLEYQFWFEQWFGKSTEGQHLRLKVHSSDFFLALSDFWTILPAASAARIAQNPHVRVHKIENPPPKRMCCSIYQREGNHELQHAMLDIMREYVMKNPNIESI